MSRDPFAKYDEWKLSSPYDNEIELYQTELPIYYSDSEEDINNFENAVIELAEKFKLTKETDL
jgi:hypothetical protein